MKAHTRVIFASLLAAPFAWSIAAYITVRYRGHLELACFVTILLVMLIAIALSGRGKSTLMAYGFAGAVCGWIFGLVLHPMESMSPSSRLHQLESDPWSYFLDVSFVTGATLVGSIAAVLLWLRRDE